LLFHYWIGKNNPGKTNIFELLFLLKNLKRGINEPLYFDSLFNQISDLSKNVRITIYVSILDNEYGQYYKYLSLPSNYEFKKLKIVFEIPVKNSSKEDSKDQIALLSKLMKK
jgi:AAA15 family ATPase/GTPase